MKKICSIFLALLLAVGMAYMAPPAEAAGKKLIAITFDDGPCAGTKTLLDGLKARGVKATFFMVGTGVANYPDLVERMYREGHQLANHSYNHPNLDILSASAVKNQIKKTSDLLDKAAGKGSSYMVRAPYGNSNAAVKQVVGAPLIYWSMDPQDWLYPDTERVKNHVVSHSYDGAIILLHDIHPTSIPAALGAIDILKAQGYEFVTMAELFRRRGVTPQNGVVYRDVKPTGTDLGPVTKPVISSKPVGGRLQVTITAQKGASIYYTTTGGELNQSSKRYTGPFFIDAACTVKAVAAYNMNGSRSDPVEAKLTPVAATPDITMANNRLTLSTSTSNATVYYSLNNGRFQKYTGPVTVRPGTEISAYAQRQGYLNSSTARASYSSRGNLLRDVFPGDWCYEDIDRGVSAGYISGVGNHFYSPNGKLQRDQLITMLYRFSGETVPDGAVAALPFTDVPKNAYYTEAVAWAYANHIVDGTSPTRFSPGKAITRQEMSKMIYGYLLTKGLNLPDSTGVAAQYSDQNQIAPWAYDSVEQMTALKLLVGTGNEQFSPTGQSTRAQGVTVLVRLADLLASGELEPLPEPDPEPEPDEPEPTEPTDPTEPTEPAEPTEPPESNEPAESTEPTEPDPSEPTPVPEDISQE